MLKHTSTHPNPSTSYPHFPPIVPRPEKQMFAAMQAERNARGQAQPALGTHPPAPHYPGTRPGYPAATQPRPTPAAHAHPYGYGGITHAHPHQQSPTSDDFNTLHAILLDQSAKIDDMQATLFSLLHQMQAQPDNGEMIPPTPGTKSRGGRPKKLPKAPTPKPPTKAPTPAHTPAPTENVE